MPRRYVRGSEVRRPLVRTKHLLANKYHVVGLASPFMKGDVCGDALPERTVRDLGKIGYFIKESHIPE